MPCIPAPGPGAQHRASRVYAAGPAPVAQRPTTSPAVGLRVDPPLQPRRTGTARRAGPGAGRDSARPGPRGAYGPVAAVARGTRTRSRDGPGNRWRRGAAQGGDITATMSAAVDSETSETSTPGNSHRRRGLDSNPCVDGCLGASLTRRLRAGRHTRRASPSPGRRRSRRLAALRRAGPGRRRAVWTGLESEAAAVLQACASPALRAPGPPSLL